jgi:hypothetical protein
VLRLHLSPQLSQLRLAAPLEVHASIVVGNVYKAIETGGHTLCSRCTWS